MQKAEFKGTQLGVETRKEVNELSQYILLEYYLFGKGCDGKGNIGVHSKKEKRYICHVCQETFSASKGTLLYRLRTDPKTVLLVIALLVYGCPIQAIVHAFGFDERTVRNWWQRAGRHCQVFHERLVEQHQLDLGQVQADEIKAKT